MYKFDIQMFGGTPGPTNSETFIKSNDGTNILGSISIPGDYEMSNVVIYEDSVYIALVGIGGMFVDSDTINTGPILGLSRTIGAVSPDFGYAVGDNSDGVGIFYIVTGTHAGGINNLSIASTAVSKMMIGNTNVIKVYIGSTLVYDQSAGAPTFDIYVSNLTTILSNDTILVEDANTIVEYYINGVGINYSPIYVYYNEGS